MKVFGWVLFTIGSLLLLIFGAVGYENVMNLASVIIGMSLMISGSIFIASGRLESAFRGTKNTSETHSKNDGIVDPHFEQKPKADGFDYESMIIVFFIIGTLALAAFLTDRLF